MKNSTTITLLLCLFIGLTACTIEKRAFRPGYHIEWNQRTSHLKNGTLEKTSNAFSQVAIINQENELIEIQEKTLQDQVFNSQELEDIQMNEHPIEKVTKDENNKATTFNKKSTLKPFVHFLPKHKKELNQPTDLVKKEATTKKLNIWSLMSFLLGIQTLFLLLFAIAQIELLIVAIIFSILASIAGNISLKQLKSTNKYNTTSKVFTVFGIIFSFTPIIFGLAYLINFLTQLPGFFH
ncbi:MAG: hypothetical protein KA521_02170 [Crocinitomicaceae bacterium]|nr:hypothetical protein [Crocinitomicaceae bacterium]